MRPLTGVSPHIFQGRYTRIPVLRECRSSETRQRQSWEASGVGGCTDFQILSRTMEGDGCHQDGFIPRELDRGKDKRYNRAFLTSSLLPSFLYFSGCL